MTSFWPLRPPNDEKKGSDFGEKARDRQLFIFHPKNDKMKYCFSMKDKIIQEPTANFARELYESYKKEEKLPHLR